MNSKLQLALYSLLFLAAGIALQWLDEPELRKSGWYLCGAGLVGLGFAAWYMKRGGDVHRAELSEPELHVTRGASRACPDCGCQVVRAMTAGETTDFYGYDRFVLSRPLICCQCGKPFEPPVGIMGKLAMSTAGICGLLVGGAMVIAALVGAWMHWSEMKLADGDWYKITFAIPAMLGVGCWWLTKGWCVIVRNWKTAAESNNPAFGKESSAKS